MVQIDKGSRPLTVIFWVLVAVTAMAAVLWWLVAPRSLGDERLGQSVAPTALSPETTQEEPMASTDPIAMEADQRQAAAVLASQPRVVAVVGPVTQRPNFVSPLEWMMLQGAAQQHASPEQELTRLVNFLRFNKQLELWQSLEGSPDTQRRAQVAEALLDDLPSRIVAKEYRLAQAQQLLSALLADVTGDEQQRMVRAEREQARLREAQASVPAAQPPA